MKTVKKKKKEQETILGLRASDIRATPTKRTVYADFPTLSQMLASSEYSAWVTYSKTKSSKNISSIEDMQSFVADYPEFRKLSGDVTKHVTLLGELKEAWDRDTHVRNVLKLRRKMLKRGGFVFRSKPPTPATGGAGPGGSAAPQQRFTEKGLQQRAKGLPPRAPRFPPTPPPFSFCCRLIFPLQERPPPLPPSPGSRSYQPHNESSMRATAASPSVPGTPTSRSRRSARM